MVEIVSNQFISFKPVSFFQTSSIIEVGCKDGAVVRTLASHQCGLEVPLNGQLQTESVDDGHDSAFRPKDYVSLSLGLSL